MGDAADDLFDAELRWRTEHVVMLREGCSPCDHCDGAGYTSNPDAEEEIECERCHGFGWFDPAGNPCEI